MRSCVAILTLVLLLVHALVGCCRHLDLCGMLGVKTACHDALEDDCCHDGHGSRGHHDEGPLAPCDCKLVCKTQCLSLPPEKTLIDAGNPLPSVDTVAVVSTSVGIQASHAAALSDGLDAMRTTGPPLRLHLLHQIILV